MISRSSAIAMTATVIVAMALLRGHADPQPVQAYGAGASTESLLLKEIRDDIRGMRQDMRVSMAAGGQPVPALVGDHKAIIKARCASCHAEDVADKEGKGVALTDAAGVAYDYSGLEAKHIADQVKAGKMPPGGGLSETERRALQNIPAPRGRKKG